MRVGILGCASIDNAGDVLVAAAVRDALRARLPDAELVAFAPKFPGEGWRHDFGRAIAVPPDDRMGWVAEHRLDALVIGGGGVISTHPWFRPYLLGDPARWTGPPAAWEAVCSQNTSFHAMSEAERRRFATACERLAYVSVRNHTTERLLRRCGFAGEIHVVPDPTLALQAPVETALPVLPDGPLVGFSPGRALLDPAAARFFERLLAALPALGRVVVFPFGSVYGDEDLARAAAARLPGCHLVDAPLDPFARWSLVGRMRLYVGARLHGVLAALAQGVPFLAVDEYFSDDIASSKIRELLCDADLQLHWSSPYLPSDPARKLRAIAGRAPAFALAAAQSALDRHHDALVAAVTR